MWQKEMQKSQPPHSCPKEANADAVGPMVADKAVADKAVADTVSVNGTIVGTGGPLTPQARCPVLVKNPGFQKQGSQFELQINCDCNMVWLNC